MTTGEEFDVVVRSHRLRAQRFGHGSAPLVVGLPGLSGNMRNFDFFGERIRDDLQLVALDLRGRGKSEATAQGTYGWESHALAGVSFECDFPADVRAVPAVSHPAVSFDDAATPADIDRIIAERVGAGRLVYRLDAERIAEIQPDLILTQDLCAVCAVPSGQVDDALAQLGCRARVLSLDPHSLEAVLGSIVEVGRETGSERRALDVVAELRQRLQAVRARVTGLGRPRTVVLEWPDPPFGAGHWVPDMVEAAGGLEVVGRAGVDSVRVTWEDIRAAAPAVVVHAPCGYRLAEAQRLGAELPDLPGAAVYAADANHLFSRPGPRLVDGVEALAWILHPGDVDEPPPGWVARLR